MAATDPVANLHALNDGLIKLQKSARRTVPVFLLGILATLIAAGVALYYILTLSADLHDARDALQQSQAALIEARTNLTDVNQALHEAQVKATTAADAKSIATVISDVSRSQASIKSASSSISAAATKLAPPDVPVKPQRLVAEPNPNPNPEPEPAGTFEVIPTSDGFLVLRAEPTIMSPELRRIPSGGVLQCGNASRNAGGNLWRPCTDDEGRSGYVSNKYIKRR